MFIKFMTGIGIGVSAIVLIALLSVISGTILYWIWPVAIPAVFPGLIESGALAEELSWWVAVCLTWIFGILIKGSNINNNN